MKIFNINYLNHSFIRCESFSYYTVSPAFKCNICKCKVLYQKSKVFLSLCDEPRHSKNWCELIYTCNEMVIKNIIE